MTIPTHILTRKILDRCPELNISEVQLAEDIEFIMDAYHPYEQQYGVITHTVVVDKNLALEHQCNFCESIGAWYLGWKDVKTEEYRAFFVCKTCGHTESL